MGSHGGWVLGVAVLLFCLAAVVAGRARRTSPRAIGRGTRVVTLGSAMAGWVLVVGAVTAVLSPLPRDTVAGRATAAPPQLVQAGLPTTSVKPDAPDPMAALKAGDCVEVPIQQAKDATGAPSWKAGQPEPSDCNSVDANYRVLQIGPDPCTDPLYTLESTPKDKTGKARYHLCLTFDWRTGLCYDTVDMDVPSKVDCGATGDHIVQATAVLTGTTSGAGCPRDGRGAVWVVWNKLQLTVCFRGGDNPGK
ncbi:LppU/SCO3897 family protein [Nocardia niigatensis]